MTINGIVYDHQLIQNPVDNGNCRVFLDTQIAFDSVSDLMLMKKLDHYRIRSVCNIWFRSYLLNR